MKTLVSGIEEDHPAPRQPTHTPNPFLPGSQIAAEVTAPLSLSLSAPSTLVLAAFFNSVRGETFWWKVVVVVVVVVGKRPCGREINLPVHPPPG